MTKISTRSIFDLLIHIGLVLALLAVLFLAFFFVYLPLTTHHGQTITVPDLTRMSTDELRTFLDDRNLRYEVNDCTFVAGAEPLSVLQQYPKPGSKVKEDRKIYVTLTKRMAPTLAMPKLTDMTQRSAELQLLSDGLEMGEITYVPDLAKNAVLRQFYNGKEIAPGTPVPKGAKIDLELGNGEGNTIFDIPNVIGKPLDEAKLIIKGSNLQVGTIIQQEDPEKEVGTVIRQKPEPRPGERIRVGGTVDLWVVGPIDTDESP